MFVGNARLYLQNYGLHPLIEVIYSWKVVMRGCRFVVDPLLTIAAVTVPRLVGSRLVFARPCSPPLMWELCGIGCIHVAGDLKLRCHMKFWGG